MLVLILFPFHAISAQVNEDDNNFFAILHNPISYYVTDQIPITVPTFIADPEGNPLLVKIPKWQIYKVAKTTEELLKDKKEKDPLLHNNFLIRILTFGNKASLGNLNTAYFLGENYAQYFIFAYNNKKKSFYIDKALDAPSVLLYFYSWLVNLPAKYLDIIDSNIDHASKFSKTFYEPTFLDKAILTADWIISILICIFVEIPIAIINTIIGFFTALILHPLDSLCSSIGFLYFGIVTTFNAIWNILINIVMIPIHIFL